MPRQCCLKKFGQDFDRAVADLPTAYMSATPLLFFFLWHLGSRLGQRKKLSGWPRETSVGKIRSKIRYLARDNVYLVELLQGCCFRTRLDKMHGKLAILYDYIISIYAVA